MKTVLMDKMSNALQYLNTCLAEREELMRFMAVAVLTRRNLFILGLPGQAKSDAIRRFRSCFEGMNFFGYQLTRETDEEKLFGRLDLASIVPGGVSNSVLRETPSYQAAIAELDQLYRAYETEQDDAKRSVLLARLKAAAESVSTLREALAMLHSGRPSILTAGQIPQAHLVLLDEIFKANDNALNSLLTALNERVYTNEGEEIPIATISFFAASNEMPKDSEAITLEDEVYNPIVNAQPYFDQVLERFHLYRRCVNRRQMDTVLGKMLDDMEAVKVQSRGGMYFVPRHHMDKVAIFEDFLETMNEHALSENQVDVNSMYVVDDARQREKMAHEFYLAIKKEIETYQERASHLINSGCESPSIMARWVSKIRELGEKRRRYEELFQRQITEVDNEFQTLQGFARELQVRIDHAHLKPLRPCA